MENEKETLKAEIKSLEDQITPKRERLNAIHREEADAVELRIKTALRGNGDFKPEELRYAAYVRCECGAGMAYPKNCGIHGAWYCGAILSGNASRELTHSSEMPFSFYEVKSEDQPSANGATTRPQQ